MMKHIWLLVSLLGLLLAGTNAAYALDSEPNIQPQSNSDTHEEGLEGCNIDWCLIYNDTDAIACANLAMWMTFNTFEMTIPTGTYFFADFLPAPCCQDPNTQCMEQCHESACRIMWVRGLFPGTSMPTWFTIGGWWL